MSEASIGARSLESKAPGDLAAVVLQEALSLFHACRVQYCAPFRLAVISFAGLDMVVEIACIDLPRVLGAVPEGSRAVFSSDEARREAHRRLRGATRDPNHPFCKNLPAAVRRLALSRSRLGPGTSANARPWLLALRVDVLLCCGSRPAPPCGDCRAVTAFVESAEALCDGSAPVDFDLAVRAAETFATRIVGGSMPANQGGTK